ncbi:MAG: serine/threonine protein kinase [Sphingomonadales bacterium]|nr:serine/threonine protein kinase [Sphingomonadales bacterium]
MLKNESEAVLARLEALEASVARAQGAIPTLIPGSADCENALPPPQKVGSFRLIEKIGHGGMGDVWLGKRDDGLYEQKVAIKLIQRHALVRAAAAFDDERRFLARLEHPNIARLIDGGVTEDGLPWLVMEFVEGVPIDVASVHRTDHQRVALFIRVADAVQYAHSQLVAHADLKPPNIIVDENGRVKLLDFGIAGLIGTGARGAVGSGPVTREYASPERLKGEGPSVGDDVFALGKIFARMLEGSKDTDLAAIARMAQNQDRALRYGSVASMIADLDRWRARLPVSAVTDRWRYRAKKFVGRHRVGVLATAGSLVLLSATSVIATSSYVRAERERGEALARFEDARGSAHYVSFDLLNSLAARPGTLALRINAARVAQHYLDRLAESRSAPPAARLEAAEGLLRLAAAQGRPGDPNLGQVDAAKRNLQRAWQLAGEVDGTKAQLLKVRIRLDQARLVSIAENNIDRALGYLGEARNLLDRNKTAPALLRAQYYFELTSSLEWKGEYAAAIRTVHMAKAALPPGEARDTLLLNAAIEDLLAEANFYSVGGMAAIAPYRQALAVLERADALFPKDQIIARRLMRARWALATTIVDNGEPGRGAQTDRAIERHWPEHRCF